MDKWGSFLVPELRDMRLFEATCRAVLMRGKRRGEAYGKKAVPARWEKRDIDALRPRCKAHPIERWADGI